MRYTKYKGKLLLSQKCFGFNNEEPCNESSGMYLVCGFKEVVREDKVYLCLDCFERFNKKLKDKSIVTFKENYDNYSKFYYINP